MSTTSEKSNHQIPKFESGLIESHCHLDYLKQLSTEEIIKTSLDHGIEKIVTIAVDPDNLDNVISLINGHANVYGTQGIHPHEAKYFTDEVAKKITQNLTNKKIVAVGEIGLDFHYNHSPKETQIEVFEKQLQIACDNDMPVVIHTREADEETYAVLKNFSHHLKKKGVIHSFTSSTRLAEQCLSEGFSIGFNGIVTFKNATNVRDVLTLTPVDRILIETDAPFLTPHPFRGRENAPFYIPVIATFIAEFKGMNVLDFIAQTKSNTEALFDFQR